MIINLTWITASISHLSPWDTQDESTENQTVLIKALMLLINAFTCLGLLIARTRFAYYFVINILWMHSISDYMWTPDNRAHSLRFKLKKLWIAHSMSFHKQFKHYLFYLAHLLVIMWIKTVIINFNKECIVKRTKKLLINNNKHKTKIQLFKWRQKQLQCSYHF